MYQSQAFVYARPLGIGWWPIERNGDCCNPDLAQRLKYRVPDQDRRETGVEALLK